MNRLVQDVIDDLGAEVMVNAPRSMHSSKTLRIKALEQVGGCKMCSLATVDDFRLPPYFALDQTDVAIVLGERTDEVTEARRLTKLGLVDIPFSKIYTLGCMVGQAGSTLYQRRTCQQNVETSLRAAAPSIAILYGVDAAEALGFPRHAWMRNEVAIWWADEKSERGCFVVFMPDAVGDTKRIIFSRLAMVESALNGQINLWDRIGAGGGFCTDIKCITYPERLDETGLPWCKVHKPYTPPFKTLGRNRRR